MHIRQLVRGCRRTCLWFLMAAFMALSWPMSFLRRGGFGVVVEKTPAFGWRMEFEPGAIFGFGGCCVGILHGHFIAVYRDYVPHAPAAAPVGGWATRTDGDASKWLYVGSTDFVFGYVGMGQVSGGHVAERVWQRATGGILPLWPISLVAGFLCCRIARCKWLSHQQPKTLCPTCRYDLRAHAPGQSCPECNTPIPALSRPVDSPT
jgi:hypothetical protein